MSAVIALLAALCAPHSVVVAYDQPTGDLAPGDVLIEHHVPTRAICDDRGGRLCSAGASARTSDARGCTAHFHEPYEAERTGSAGLTYIVLRCTICHRPQGMRLVRKPRP